MENMTSYDYEFSDYIGSYKAYSNKTISTHQASIVQSIAFALSTFLIIQANALILVVLHKKPTCFEEIPRLIFQALAITDLLTGMFCCFFSFLFSCAPHLQNPVTCTIRTMACTGCLNQSALTMAFASVDRYIAINWPLRYVSIVTIKRARIVICILSLISIANALFTNVGADFNPSHKTCVSDFTAVGIGIPFRPSLIVILLIFYSSLLITTFANCKVIRIALHQWSVISDKPPVISNNMNDAERPAESSVSGQIQARDRMNRVKMRSLRTVILATVMFYIAVMPWNIMASLHFADHVQIPQPLRIAAAFLIINNSWWNAIIYSLVNRTFRTAAKRVILNACGRQTTEGSMDSTIARDSSVIS